METNYVRDYKLYVSHNILYTYIVLPVDVSVGFHLDKKKCTYATSNGAIDFRWLSTVCVHWYYWTFITCSASYI